jgi:hypothetical protein
MMNELKKFSLQEAELKNKKTRGVFCNPLEYIILYAIRSKKILNGRTNKRNY